jgi:Fe-S cluster assembly protein SufD
MTSTDLNADLFRQAVSSIPSDGLSDIRQVAAISFAAQGFPTPRHEDWKYTNLDTALSVTNQWLIEPSSTDNNDFSGTEEILKSVDATWIQVRNGSFDPADLKLPAGVVVRKLTKDDAETMSLVDDPMSQFNAALLKDGVFVQIDANVELEKPLGFLISDTAAAGSAVSQYRIVADIGEGATAMFVEAHQSSGPGDHFANGLVQFRLRPHSSVDYVRLQQRARNHKQVGRTVVAIESGASFRHCGFDFGGSLVRNDIDVDLLGAGAHVGLHGVYLAGDNQHFDNHTTVHHRVGPTTSDEEYRGILNRKSRCVFNGKAIVHKGADGTDARQSNHNLLLSADAEIDTKPELEIYADDVKCSHGATVGELDASALFYIRSRGLDEDTAKQLLTRAFAAGVLQMMTIPAMQDFLAGSLDARLDSLVGADIL